MVTRIASIAVSLTLTLATASAAPPSCATPTDIDAMRISALQQQLMVAALTCRQVEAYNRFVVENRPALIEADHMLLTYFRRTQGEAGEAAYHTFKTELANTFSMHSLRNPHYCADAEALFTQAPTDAAAWLPAATEIDACPMQQAAAE